MFIGMSFAAYNGTLATGFPGSVVFSHVGSVETLLILLHYLHNVLVFYLNVWDSSSNRFVVNKKDLDLKLLAANVTQRGCAINFILSFFI